VTAPQERRIAPAAAGRGDVAEAGARRGDPGAVARADGAALAMAEVAGPRANAQTAPAASAVAQALAVLLAEATVAGTPAAATGADARAAASLIIYNAAMLPGWPYASALAKDGPSPSQDAKTALQALGAALDKMTPQEMAEYLARVGANYGLIDLIRKGLSRELDEKKQRLLGFLAVLAQVVGEVLESLRTSVTLSPAELAEIEAARAGGAERHGRRHLPL
jgi:hypothetical protein